MTDTQTVVENTADNTKPNKLFSRLAVFMIGAITGIIAFGIGYGVSQFMASQNPTVSVQMYVMAIEPDADFERFEIEQAGDQFTYELPENVLRTTLLTPNFVACYDGMAISSVLTQAAQEISCGSPAVRVVLVAPY